MDGVTLNDLVEALSSEEGISSLKKVAEELPNVTPDESGVAADGTAVDIAENTAKADAVMAAKEQAAKATGGQALADQPVSNVEDAQVSEEDQAMAAAGAVAQAASDARSEETVNTTQTSAKADMVAKTAAFELLSKIVENIREEEKTAEVNEDVEKVAEDNFYAGKLMAQGFVQGLSELTEE